MVGGVFSTSVEVFLSRYKSRRNGKGLLHVRGGVSEFLACGRSRCSSSPRPWRCFSVTVSRVSRVLVFSTSVEVFPACGLVRLVLISLLHVRGGVSSSARANSLRSRSSPRPWRCFFERLTRDVSQAVFSTSVEVFPPISINDLRQALSSPRPWRCFRHEEKLMMLGPVFSTSVEVFL